MDKFFNPYDLISYGPKKAQIVFTEILKEKKKNGEKKKKSTTISLSKIGYNIYADKSGNEFQIVGSTIVRIK